MENFQSHGYTLSAKNRICPYRGSTYPKRSWGLHCYGSAGGEYSDGIHPADGIQPHLAIISNRALFWKLRNGALNDGTFTLHEAGCSAASLKQERWITTTQKCLVLAPNMRSKFWVKPDYSLFPLHQLIRN